MRHRRILALVVGLFSTLSLLGDGQAEEPIPVPPTGAPLLANIPTPAMPPALIPASGPACADCKMVVPPFPSGYHLPACPDCKGTSSQACPTCSTSSVASPGSACPTCAVGPGKKVCATTEEVKKVTKPVYSTKEVEFCVPHCSLFGSACGKVRTKTVLVKKLVTEEKIEKKCEVKTVHDPVPQPAVAPYPYAPSPTLVPPPVVAPSQPAVIQFGSPLPVTAPPAVPMPEKTGEQPTYLPSVR